MAGACVERRLAAADVAGEPSTLRIGNVDWLTRSAQHGNPLGCRQKLGMDREGEINVSETRCGILRNLLARIRRLWQRRARCRFPATRHRIYRRRFRIRTYRPHHGLCRRRNFWRPLQSRCLARSCDRQPFRMGRTNPLLDRPGHRRVRRRGGAVRHRNPQGASSAVRSARVSARSNPPNKRAAKRPLLLFDQTLRF
jgi:hypothetical protein